MKELVPPLLALQEIDVQIRMARQDRAAHEERIRRAEAEAEAGREMLRKRDEELKEVRKETDRQDVDLKGIEQEIQRFKVQLNAVKTNKEYAALLHEIGSREADKGSKEEQLLEVLDQAETAQARVREAKARLEQTEGKVRAEASRIRQGIAEVDRALANLERKRTAARSGIPAEVVDRYERIFQVRGTALATVDLQKGTCGGCFMELRPQALNLIALAKDWFYCPSCNRILYAEEKALEASREAWGRAGGEP